MATNEWRNVLHLDAFSYVSIEHVTFIALARRNARQREHHAQSAHWRFAPCKPGCGGCGGRSESTHSGARSGRLRSFSHETFQACVALKKL